MSTVAQYARAWKFQLNTPFTATNTIFVDSFAGDDLRGLGTMSFPFQTLNKAVVFANSNSKSYIICRGYFSENIANGFSKNIFADQLGEAIFDGQNIYIFNSIYMGGGMENNGVICTNFLSSINYAGSYCIYLNSCYSASGMTTSRSVIKGIPFTNLSLYGTGNIFYSTSQYLSYIDFFNANRGSGSSHIKNIYDNCKVYLDKINTGLHSFDTCLFRANCTFWKRKADNSGDERVDTDAMTAIQKQAAIMEWLNTGTLATGYYKYTFINCQWTDNRVFNCPDNDRSGTNWDFSLIYGTKEAQPACYMDGGKHIGPFPPAIKIEVKNTADLTSSMYEIEVKTSDNINNVNGSLSLGVNFTGATLYSKPMLIPAGTQFNGFNLSLFPDAGNSGVFLTGQTDSFDTSDTNKITLSAAGTILSANVCYLVRVDSGTTAIYNGTSYNDKSVLMATDSTTLVTKSGGGNAYLYPINHPSIWQNVQFKICETGTVPSDFKTNDTFYPWLSAELFSKPADVRGVNATGLRCLRVGNVNSGVIDTGSDGKPLTSAHPEYYNTTNQARPKYFVRATYVLMKITITRFFS